MSASPENFTDREKQNELLILAKLQDRLNAPERGLQGSLEPVVLDGFNPNVKVYVKIYEEFNTTHGKMLNPKFVTHHDHDSTKMIASDLKEYQDPQNKVCYYTVPDAAKADPADIDEVHNILKRVGTLIQRASPESIFEGSANASFTSGLPVEGFENRRDYGSSVHHAEVKFPAEGLDAIQQALSSRITELAGEVPLVGENAVPVKGRAIIR